MPRASKRADHAEKANNFLECSLKQPRRLLFFAPSAYPFGGVADWLAYLLPGLEAKGWESVLALTTGNCHDHRAYISRQPWERIHVIRNPTGTREGRVRALRDAIDTVQPCTVVVVNLADAYDAIRRIRRPRGRPPSRVQLVCALHGLQGDLLGDIGANSDVIDAVITPNRLSTALAARALNAPERALYAPCGVPVAEYAPINTDSLKPRQPIRLLYAGRLEQDQKRVYDLAELLSRLQQDGVAARLSIAGSGADEAQLRKRFNEMGVAGAVDWLGVLAPANLVDAYQRHDMLVVTSCWETGPIVIWEAMSHGLAVVSSRYVGSGLEGALQNLENCFLFDVGDMKAAALAVMHFSDQQLCQRVVANAHRLVAARYSRDASVAAWDVALSRVNLAPALPFPTAAVPISPSGRLDRLLGAGRAESVRRLFGLHFRHFSPGSEWPHTRHGYTKAAEDHFLATARKEDFC